LALDEECDVESRRESYGGDCPSVIKAVVIATVLAASEKMMGI
jgi:hypothetical protein